MPVLISHPGDVPAAARRPAGALERLHSLRDGTVVRLRPIGPADADELRAGFARLSPESRYRRFFSPVPRLPDAMVRRLTATGGWNHVALAAESIPLYDGPPEPLGVVRFIRFAGRPNAAEVAISVIDEMQGRGLGVVLLGALAELARAEGVTTFVATVLADNEPMHRLIRRIGRVATVRREQGTYVYEVRLGSVG
ncbi:MAG: GNAT family N-acetyltransferase [Thermodesulfobacteriota bacterium]